jgi:hypothetical protein
VRGSIRLAAQRRCVPVNSDVMSHDDGLSELSAALTAAGVANELYHDCIHIPLAGSEAMVEVKVWVGGERSVQLFRGNESRSLVTVPGEFECAPEEAVVRLFEKLAECGLEMRRVDSGDGA